MAIGRARLLLINFFKVNILDNTDGLKGEKDDLKALAVCVSHRYILVVKNSVLTNVFALKTTYLSFWICSIVHPTLGIIFLELSTL